MTAQVIDIRRVPETNYIILDTYWYPTEEDTKSVGLVLVEDSYTHQTQAYIGCGCRTSKHDSEINIAQYGSKCSKKMAEIFFGPQPNYKHP